VKYMFVFPQKQTYVRRLLEKRYLKLNGEFLW